jgi:hypothetical protein
MGLHVCGDGVVRVVDVIDEFCTHYKFQHLKILQETRAAIYTSASQASYIGVVASSLTSGYTNSSVASSKKISVCALCLNS